ncbi:MAG: hypothetical protein E7396_08430 [Ruminococcaceae bacterium]|nr:hypothetical protein [Oscillospiraceae bacterium]
MYYSLIILATAMFGVCFALKGAYVKLCGDGIKQSFEFTFVSSIVAMIALIVINGFKWEFTWFTFIMALISTVNGFLFTICSFKALGKINLSVFSVYSMLGGMLLPFLQGIIFYNEEITVAKILCVFFIIIALVLTIEKGDKMKGMKYYAGVFVFNGMSGVISKIFNTAPFERTSAEAYSIMGCALSAIIALAVILTVFNGEKNRKSNWGKTILFGGVSGITNRVANLLLLIALLHVDTSVQYPLVTGGVMVVSSIINLFGENKPSKKELYSVGVAFVGMLALFLIKI